MNKTWNIEEAPLDIKIEPYLEPASRDAEFNNTKEDMEHNPNKSIISFESEFIKTKEDGNILEINAGPEKFHILYDFPDNFEDIDDPVDANNVPNNLFQCDICHTSLSNIMDFINHKRSHPNDNPFECSKCSKKFPTSSTLNLHIKTDHSNDDETMEFKCNICNKRFATNRNLESHKLNHQQQQCYICHKMVSKKVFLRHCMATHLNFQQIECNICHKFNGCAADLKTHMKIHLNDNRFECELCAKQFCTRHNYKRHLQTHKTRKESITGNLP